MQGAGDGEAFNYYEDDDENHFGTFATSRKNPSSHKTSSSIGSNGRKQVCSTGISEKAQGENIINKQLHNCKEWHDFRLKFVLHCGCKLIKTTLCS